MDIYNRASDLPTGWDRIAGGNGALLTENLKLLERVNPCRQQYVIFKAPEGQIAAILVHYQLKMDIFSYSRLHLRLPVTVIGIPCSVAEPGYAFAEGKQPSGEVRSGMRAYLTALEGSKLVLNARSDLDFLGFSSGMTLPNCEMAVRWTRFDAYMMDLRSHYRYRYHKALDKAKPLTIEGFDQTASAAGPDSGAGGFDGRHYKLYEQVYERSGYKLEKLPMAFFQQSVSDILVFKLGPDPVAFVQYQIRDHRLTFLFGGLDYNLNQRYDLYLNMLLLLVRKAIEAGCATISLGQTAEEVKCRLGASLELKYLYLQHSNRLINRLAAKFSGLFSYDVPGISLQVFNNNREDAS
jgi:hypothetical protein